MLDVIDEFTHECLAIRVARKLEAIDVIDALSDLFVLCGVPGHVRSDDGPEFVAKAVQAWIGAAGAKTASIAPGSPWENGSIESFNARLRDELLDGEIFYGLREAQVVIESWRRPCNAVRPHASLGCRAPAPEGLVPALAMGTAVPRRPASPAMPQARSRDLSGLTPDWRWSEDGSDMDPYAAARMASTATVRRRWISRRRSAGTCWPHRVRARRKDRGSSWPRQNRAADLGHLKPRIGRHRPLMPRWSCSRRLFR